MQLMVDNWFAKKYICEKLFTVDDLHLESLKLQGRVVMYENLYMIGNLVLHDNNKTYECVDELYVRKSAVDGFTVVSIGNLDIYESYKGDRKSASLSNDFYLIFDSKNEAARYKLKK